MKQFLVAFFIIISAGSAVADNYVIFKSEIVEKAINQLVASENRQRAADEYQNSMDQNSGKISVLGLYKVCIAAGFNVQTNDGYNLCRNFLNFMISETENMGFGTASQKTCANQFNGVWTINADGTMYECVGRDGYKLVYKKSCDGYGGECITVFADLQTQGSNGREFINAYGKLHGLNLTCHSVIETRRGFTSPLGQDYIKCSAGGKSYEFEFDDLNQTPGDTSAESENKAICELYGGKIVDTGDEYIEKLWQSCDVTSDLCNGAIHGLALRIGHTNMYQGYCRLSRNAETISVVKLKQIDGIDSRIFYNAGAQMRIDTAKPMVEEYLRTKFPNETYIVCNSAPTQFQDGFGIDIDYILSCNVGGKQVDFVFDDLSETSNMAANAGINAMQCIITGGNYDGKFCRWLNEDECNALNEEQQNVARWDEKAGACVMLDSSKYNAFKNGVMAIGGTVVGVAVTVATGGSALVVFAVVATDAAFEGAFAIFQRLQEINPQHRAVQFIKETQDCHDSACASKAITNHFVRLDEIMNDLNTDMQNAIMDHFDYLSGLLTEEEFNNALNASGLKIEDKVYNASAAALFLIAIVGNPDKALTEALEKTPHLITKLDNWANLAKLSRVDDVIDIAKLARTDDVIDLRKIVSKGDEAKSLIAYSDDLEKSFLDFMNKKVNRWPSPGKLLKAQDYLIDLSEFSQWNKLSPESQRKLLDFISPKLTNFDVEVHGMEGSILNVHDVFVENYFHSSDASWVERHAVEMRPWNESSIGAVAKKLDGVTDVDSPKNLDQAKETVALIAYSDEVKQEFAKFLSHHPRIQREGLLKKNLDPNFVLDLKNFKQWEKLTDEAKEQLVKSSVDFFTRNKFKIQDVNLSSGELSIFDVRVYDYNSLRYYNIR